MRKREGGKKKWRETPYTYKILSQKNNNEEKNLQIKGMIHDKNIKEKYIHKEALDGKLN